MTYKNLDEIPYKLFVKIYDSLKVDSETLEETYDYTLLSTDSEEDTDTLKKYWLEMLKEHKKTKKEDKPLEKSTIKEIDKLKVTYDLVLISIEVLMFDFNEEIYKILIKLGYSIDLSNTENYYNSLVQAKKDAEGYLHIIKDLQKKLPKIPEGQEKTNVDLTMSVLSSILGYSIGKHNEVTYREFYAHIEALDKKIETLKKQNNGK